MTIVNVVTIDALVNTGVREMTIPYGLETFMHSVSYGITALLAVVIWWASGRAGLASRKRAIAWLVAMTVLVSWQLLGETLARAGVFSTGPESVASWMGVALPLIQFYRAIGVVFLILWAGNYLPGAFALPAGLGDVATGLAAPIVAYTIERRPDKRLRVVWWSVFGTADLVVAVVTATLTSPGAAQLLAFDAPNRMIFSYPLALVPLYGVPIAFMLHGLVWQRLARRSPALATLSPAE
jgi:hypothetical protein